MAKKITERDFERIIAHEIKNGNGFNAYIHCYQLALLMVKQSQDCRHKHKTKLLSTMEVCDDCGKQLI